MKKTVITALLVLAACLTAYPKSHMPTPIEVAHILPATVIGIDGNDKDATVSLLVQNIKDGDTEATGGAEDMTVKVETAATVAQAVYAIKSDTSKVIINGSIECFLLGEDAAKGNLRQNIDYLSKDNALKLDAAVLIVRGGDAAEVVELACENHSFDELYIFEGNSALTGRSTEMTFLDLLFELCEEPCAFAIPTVSVDPASGEVRREGCAIFTDGAFSGYIEPELARAYNIILNKAVNSVIEVRGEIGEIACMIEDAATMSDFRFDGDTLTEIVVRTTINTDMLDAAASGAVGSFQARQADVIRHEMTALINLSREYKSDFLKFGTQLRLQHPYRWERVKDDWTETLARTPVRIEVEVLP